MKNVWLGHSIFMSHAMLLGYLVTTGECLVGTSLILGCSPRLLPSVVFS